MKLRSALTALTLTTSLFCAPLYAIAQEANELPARVTGFALTEAPDDHVVGSEDAALTLIIWASVTCPHCADWFSNQWPQVKTELVETGNLRVVFREFPTAPGDMAMTGFRLAECAPREDYMSIIEFQMEHQDDMFKAREEGKSPEAYAIVAEIAGMETNEAIATCFRNPDITAHILDNASRATIAEIKSVPAFLINGQYYKGNSDAKSLIALVTEMNAKGISALPKDTKSADKHSGHDHK